MVTTERIQPCHGDHQGDAKRDVQGQGCCEIGQGPGYGVPLAQTKAEKGEGRGKGDCVEERVDQWKDAEEDEVALLSIGYCIPVNISRED
ncbi:hypothetical protein [Actibacterium sp. 188UL27-1]|uniref:hypothetical protein n=1 Tax=Actibacterium sp. 188UL27-1 TaxID=2786961 RepID=UPI001958FBBF|nr:hypothetical protein [Actibacterium sp. 188UL27-1]MBM7066884.1 hypothetical protein [Actibacterium sp. 188UL27-1]